LTLPRPQTPQQALRLVAAVLTVTLVLLVGFVGDSTRDEDRPTYDHYVAIGDSYTAAPFVPLTDVARGCYRSSNNYPHLLATSLHIEDLQDRSCSGAETKDLTQSQVTTMRRKVPPQLDALTERTDLVTVGIGANDGHLYARIASDCRRVKRFCPLYDERESLRRIVGQLRTSLAASLEEIRERAPKARVLLIGYPKLFPPRGDCDRLPRMRPQDRATFRDINLRLRQEMLAAARDAEVEFVDFYATSLRHNVCARHPWVQGRVGNYRMGAALHPLPAGQAALARTIERVLRHPASSRAR
jgi:lysophospholipase L1-like esterase